MNGNTDTFGRIGSGSARIVPAAAGMEEAAARLRDGRLVAFPTETVYGLGANALDPAAVAAIFAAKGRPSTNPIIVHVAEPEAVAPLVREWSETAARLAGRFWPGPLTLVVLASNAVPKIVTAGGDTVGIRIPSHPVARELLRQAGIPVAAPSANRSEEVSPTTARHVADSLGPWTDDLLILDGGPCDVGVESTVLDVTVHPPRLLRPGMVTRDDLAAVAGEIAGGAPAAHGGTPRSPGQMRRHYAPRAPVVLTRTPYADLQPGDALLTWLPGEWAGGPVACSVPTITLPGAPRPYAARLYAALREIDAAGARRIVIALPPDEPEWAAIHDRLQRAAAAKETENA